MKIWNISDNFQAFCSNEGTLAFGAMSDVTIDAGVQTNLTGGSPAGGVYSGSGVTDQWRWSLFYF